MPSTTWAQQPHRARVGRAPGAAAQCLPEPLARFLGSTRTACAVPWVYQNRLRRALGLPEPLAWFLSFGFAQPACEGRGTRRSRTAAAVLLPSYEPAATPCLPPRVRRRHASAAGTACVSRPPARTSCPLSRARREGLRSRRSVRR